MLRKRKKNGTKLNPVWNIIVYNNIIYSNIYDNSLFIG